jgi:uncharacterized protein Yka (UPF0111/DUF47 family)
MIENKYDEDELKNKSINELTHLFMDIIHEQNILLIEGIESLVKNDFKKFKNNLECVAQTTTEVQVKKAFESKIFKAKLMFSKADRLKLFSKINDTKNIGEYLTNRMLLYRVVFPDNEFKLQLSSILKSLKLISNELTKAVKLIGDDLEKAYDICEEIKEERRKMRIEEWELLNRLYNYDMDYISRTFLYLKNMIEDIMMLADHIKNFSEYIQFLSAKYLIFK